MAVNPTIATKTAFTENWLQALTQSVSIPDARLVKPMMTDIDTVCQLREQADQEAAALRVWEYATANGLQPILEILPTQQTEWRFHDDEIFVYRLAKPASCQSISEWSNLLGILPAEFPLIATVTEADWADLLRKEAVRQRKSINVTAMSESGTQEQPCVAKWDRKQWSITFDKAEWVTISHEDPFVTDRFSLDEVQDRIMTAAIDAETRLIPKTVPGVNYGFETAWMNSVSSLLPLHQAVLQGQSKNSNAWFRKTWAAVWPVIYREQNRLSQPCELHHIRSQLAECFATVPRLTVWMFVMAKLVCVAQLNRGLGVGGDFRRDTN